MAQLDKFELPPSSPDAAIPLIPWQSRHCRVITLPPQFPQSVAPPKYAFGTHCRWALQPHADAGVVIGQVYAPDQREDPVQWSWVYLILLHPSSPSWGWIVADWVDEADLEPLPSPRSR
ncbi:MAG: hypothetical protein Kow00121_60190 [Elainellaceae cyanobacterium]